ncbi:glycoprotein [Streptomyces tagetis]|uniref:Glycoprotein n=1 Tax=Streptomyces tagetis TaxID=2820809 RepID=A0A940XTC4_9ACTN|nr:glycoprotein [Streptomyces sp. RG38]MBQ0830519.1 glycoprotein [Streptomyces sp. RG38]
MTRTHQEPAPGIDAALRAAQALTSAYDDYDTDRALRRVTALADGRATDPATRAQPPAPYPTAHEQAAHDLDLAVTLIVDSPQAHVSLARLVDLDRIEPEGALVFAALLRLAGYGDQAQFWFEFAAGAGNRTAAFCLYLLHQGRAEHRAAAYWRGQARTAAAPAEHPAPARRRQRPLLSEGVRRELISRCWEGRRPTLPPRLEAVIHGLPVDCADEDFGEIPRPDDVLTRLPGHEHPPG